MPKNPPASRRTRRNRLGQDDRAQLKTVFSEMMTDLGHLSEKAGEFASALRNFEAAVELAPKDSLCWYNYGDALLSLGRNEEAVSALEHAVHLSPDDALYRYDLGLALYVLGKYQEATEQFQWVVRSDPKLERAKSHLGLSAVTNLALCHGEQGNLKKALETLEPAQGLAVGILYNLGRFHLLAKSHAEAARLLRAGALLALKDEDILHGAGCALMNLKQHEEAESYFMQATKVDPSCVDGWYDRGVNLARMNKRKQARACFLQVLKKNPRHPWAYYDLACLDALERKRESAFRNLQRATDRGLRAAAHAQRDRDLVSLHSDPRWKGFLARMKEST